jgi:hypothetical protein
MMTASLQIRLGALALSAAWIALGYGYAAAEDAEIGSPPWQWACFEQGSLVESNRPNLELLRDAAVAHFDANPITFGGDQLELWQAFEDPSSSRTVLVLYTLLLSDTSVVYVFDDQRNIIDHFASSSWRSPVRDSTPAGSYRALCR